MQTLEKFLEESEYQRAINSVLLLRDMHGCQDPILRCRLFEQACDQEASHIAEVLPGSVHTKFQFESIDGELYVLQPDGVINWLALHKNGLRRASRMARANPELKFYEHIAEAELKEAEIQKKMVSDGHPQTMVTLSLCGEDIASSDSLKSVGRDPELRRAYLRTSIFDGENLHIDSRTMDYMTLHEAKKIYKEYLGVELSDDTSSIDILSTRKVLPGARFDLPDKISTRPSFNTYNFVLSQPDLLESHMDSLTKIATMDFELGLDKYADALRYDIMSSFKQRLEGKWINLGSLGESVANAGSIERGSGTQYSGCDTVVSKHNGNPEDAGYVNALGREFWVWREGTCRIPNCPSRQKDKKDKPKIGPCNVCEACQPLFDKGMEMNDIEIFYKRQPKAKKNKIKQPDFFEIISRELAKYSRQK